MRGMSSQGADHSLDLAPRASEKCLPDKICADSRGFGGQRASCETATWDQRPSCRNASFFGVRRLDAAFSPNRFQATALHRFLPTPDRGVVFLWSVIAMRSDL
jgi:hypothetical protein